MKQSRFSEAQIVSILKQAENGVPVPALCREHGMSSASFYKWWSKYGGMDVSMISRMKALQAENQRLKKRYADLILQNELIKEALEKSGKAVSALRDGQRYCCREEGEHPPCLPSIFDQRELLPVSTEAVR